MEEGSKRPAAVVLFNPGHGEGAACIECNNEYHRTVTPLVEVRQQASYLPGEPRSQVLCRYSQIEF
jgi:hypothetical protein